MGEAVPTAAVTYLELTSVTVEMDFTCQEMAIPASV